MIISSSKLTFSSRVSLPFIPTAKLRMQRPLRSSMPRSTWASISSTLLVCTETMRTSLVVGLPLPVNVTRFFSLPSGVFILRIFSLTEGQSTRQSRLTSRLSVCKPTILTCFTSTVLISRSLLKFPLRPWLRL